MNHLYSSVNNHKKINCICLVLFFVLKVLKYIHLKIYIFVVWSLVAENGLFVLDEKKILLVGMLLVRGKKTPIKIGHRFLLLVLN